jgi:hypothetical protein
MIESTDRETVRDDLRSQAKGGEVFRFGSGLGLVLRNDTPISTDGTELLIQHGWVIGGIYYNSRDNEIAVFTFPIETVIA